MRHHLGRRFWNASQSKTKLLIARPLPIAINYYIWKSSNDYIQRCQRRILTFLHYDKILYACTFMQLNNHLVRLPRCEKVKYFCNYSSLTEYIAQEFWLIQIALFVKACILMIIYYLINHICYKVRFTEFYNNSDWLGDILVPYVFIDNNWLINLNESSCFIVQFQHNSSPNLVIFFMLIRWLDVQSDFVKLCYNLINMDTCKPINLWINYKK